LKPWRCFNCGIQDHFVQDYRKLIEEALLANDNEEAMLL
jgi:DNA-directed RNA polymerase subunit N (RpoN/RPB10)